MNVIAAASQAEPGWSKLLALLIAIAVCWTACRVLDRIKRVREGKEANPFSLDGTPATPEPETQVSTPPQGVESPTQKGFKKWFQKG